MQDLFGSLLLCYTVLRVEIIVELALRFDGLLIFCWGSFALDLCIWKCSKVCGICKYA